MKLVLDASAAVTCVLRTSSARRLDALLAEADALVVPDLFVAEVTNAIWKCRVFGSLDPAVCEAALDDVLQLPTEIVPSAGLAIEVYHAARTTRCTAYDLFYAILARRLSVPLLTLDQKLRRYCNSAGIEIVA
ncbi:MAG: type II toxin-antitoxin system VapC family toxin [Deltaproteobacteria bacterium]|nr:type II toxin-antitoxin system VapC family toxin [Deltaproteobacteria bacterium]